MVKLERACNWLAVLTTPLNVWTALVTSSVEWLRSVAVSGLAFLFITCVCNIIAARKGRNNP